MYSESRHEAEGIEERLNARSNVERGRMDIAALVETKLLVGDGVEADFR